MDLGWLLGMLGFAFAMAGSPGPNNTIATACGASHGVSRALPFVSGVGTGVALIMLMVAAFGMSLVTQPQVGNVLKWVGVAYLVWLAWTIATSEPQLKTPGTTASKENSPPSFVQGALFQFVNPKLWVMVSGALVAYGHGGVDVGTLPMAAFLAVVFGVITTICAFAWAAMGGVIGRVLATERTARLFNGAMGGLLIVSLLPILRD